MLLRQILVFLFQNLQFRLSDFEDMIRVGFEPTTSVGLGRCDVHYATASLHMTRLHRFHIDARALSPCCSPPTTAFTCFYPCISEFSPIFHSLFPLKFRSFPRYFYRFVGSNTSFLALFSRCIRSLKCTFFPKKGASIAKCSG